MNQFSQDPFYRFIELYESGQIQQAEQIILTSPNVKYDELHSEESAFRYLVNFVDACVFKKASDIHFASISLANAILSDKRLSIICRSFLEQLEKEKIFLYCYFLDRSGMEENNFLPTELWLEFIKLHEQKQIENHDIENALNLIPPFYQPMMKQKFQILQNWKQLEKIKPNLCLALQEKHKIQETQPWHAFAYSSMTMAAPKLKEGKFPLLFLEPVQDFDYEQFLAPLGDQEALFVFETVEMLFQLLQFPTVVDSLLNPKHAIYVLDIYPNSQFFSQGWFRKNIQEFQLIQMIENKAIQDNFAVFLEGLSQVIFQSEDQMQIDSPISNRLYQIAKRMLFNIQSARYGESRAIALNMGIGYEAWYDKHKGLPPPEASLGPLVNDYLKEKINELNLHRKVRPFAPRSKIRLAHVVAQVVDGGHAPTRLVVNLLGDADRNWFDLFLISTEKFSERPLEYPVLGYVSQPSIIRGIQTLQFLHHHQVKFSIGDYPLTIENEAHRLVEFLHEQAIDIVVFHGPDEINSLCSALTDVPIRVLFDHGTLPRYPCYDLLILSTEEDFLKHREEYHAMGMESCPLPFAMDVKIGWEEKPYPKEDLGLPVDSFVMTTISNHLENRLSLAMCHAIGEILQRCPKAYYAPIGKMEHPERFFAIFEHYGVKERVKFLGRKPNPSQCSRCMELYLNEFPFGSGIGILEAMATGCPIVSMYDENGPQQSRYGGVYFGKEWVIQSGKKEDYVELACQLINDPEMYQKWSQHALAQYENHVDVKLYVKTFEKILEKFIEYYQKKINSSQAYQNPPQVDE